PEEVEGDLTGDGKCSIADAVMLQKYLLTSGTLTADQAKAADINKDQQLDSADLSRLKKLILGNQ
ncbi:MAG: dockerin type I repeat-containing protein, partial [Oscillospiraceae bacterium]|nr:dockerin type I repeat-containing protein [Oscillospiraceae bacterium]